MQCTEQTANSVLIYAEAKLCMGQSLVPVGDNPDLGCAISLTSLINDKCGIQIGKTLSTAELLAEFMASPRFREVHQPVFGDIIISATGTSKILNTPITHGHCGVIAKFGILSNNSHTGIWSEMYTLDTWKQRYEIQGGYPTRYFRAV